jgi:hypothetical protein
MANIMKLDHGNSLATASLRSVQKVAPRWLDRIRLGTHQKPLLELISLGLNKETLGRLMAAVEESRSIGKIHPESDESNAYLAKILREEVLKQFSEKNRPLVELILNAIDARPKESKGAYVVDVKVGKDSFQVSDNGKGMVLQKILDTLIIPFNSDKDALQDIGRFGIGFFSNLQYCLEKPQTTAVLVRTGDGKSAYELKVDATGSTVDQLVCGIRKINSAVQGTTVQVTGIELKKPELEEYLTSYLRFFDPRRAVIKVNNTPVNLLRNVSPLVQEYSIDVELEHNGEKLTQEMRVSIDIHRMNGEERPGMYLYSQGIFVKSYNLAYGTMRIDFPSAVYPVEGRDQFKNDENYKKCLMATMEVLIKYCEDHKDNLAALLALREIVPAFMSELNVYRDDSTKQRLRATFFPEETYMVVDNDLVGASVTFRDFFGDSSISRMYIPKTNTAWALWKDILPREAEFVRNSIDASSTVEEPRLNELSGQVFGRHLQNADALSTHGRLSMVLVRLKSQEETRSPVLRFNDCMYINVDHPFFQKEGYVEGYGVRAATARELRKDEKEAEDELMGC